jgi:hypothetical protein
LVDFWVVASVRTVVLVEAGTGQQPGRDPARHHDHRGGKPVY